MSTGLGILIAHVNDTVVFDLSRAVSFDFFVISNAAEHVFWELKPESLQRVPVLDAAMIGMRVPVELRSEVGELVRDIGRAHSETDGPEVTRIVYGSIPSGYREVVGATPLRGGETYCVFMWGDGFEATREYFVG